MPQTLTRDFGWMDYDDAAELQFPCGLAGFEDEKRFVLIEKEPWAPIVFLQSLETQDLCFLAVSVQAVDPGYQIGMTDDDERLIAIQDALSEEVACLTVLVAEEDGSFSANLLAPLVINLRTRIAVQAVRADTRYSHQHPLGKPVACS